MQLLRDNLTLWTSSDGAEAEPATDAAPKEEKPAETAAPAADAPAEATTTEETPAAAPAPTAA
jgi:14-3-3 protein epsilon